MLHFIGKELKWGMHIYKRLWGTISVNPLLKAVVIWRGVDIGGWRRLGGATPAIAIILAAHVRKISRSYGDK